MAPKKRLMRRILTTPTILTVFSILPVLYPEGTSFSETAKGLQTYGSLGVLVSEAFSWWAKTAIQWFEATNRDWNTHWWFIPAIILPTPWVAVPVYFAIRIFDHGLQWSALFTEFSFSAMWTALVFSVLGSSISTVSVMSTTNLSRNQHPFIQDAEAPPRWVIVPILFGILLFPLFCLWLLRVFT